MVDGTYTWSKKCLREKLQDLIRNLYQQQQHKQQQQKNHVRNESI